MAHPDQIYGLRTVPSRAMDGRPLVTIAVGDSVITDWFGRFFNVLPGVVGYDAILGGNYGVTPVSDGGDLRPPTLPGSHVDGYWSYLSRNISGTTTLSSAYTSGQTNVAVTLNSGVFPLGGGIPASGFTLTLTNGANTASARIHDSYGTAITATSPIGITASLGQSFGTSGTVVSWSRPSGIDDYYWGTKYEILFATAASPQDVNWYDGRLIDIQLVGTTGEGVESKFLHDGPVMNSGSIDVALFYLKLPVNSGAPNLQLVGRTSEPSPQQVTAGFSIYSATADIGVVTLTLPAPLSYSDATAPRFTVNSPNAGNFTAGQVFAPFLFLAMPHGATSGHVLIHSAIGGTWLQDLDDSSFGSEWSSAWITKLMTAMATTPFGAIDNFMIEMGVNNTPASTSLITASLNAIRSKIMAGNTNAAFVGLSTYKTPGLVSGSGSNISAAYVNWATNTSNVCVFDLWNAAGNENFLNLRYLSDGTHPSDQGADYVAGLMTGFYRTAQSSSDYPSATNVVSGITFDYNEVGTAPQYTTALGASLAAGSIEVALGGVAARSFVSLVNGAATDLTGGPLVSVWRNGTQTALVPGTAQAQVGYYLATEPATIANGFAIGDSCWFRVNGTNSAGSFTVDKPFTIVPQTTPRVITVINRDITPVNS